MTAQLRRKATSENCCGSGWRQNRFDLPACRARRAKGLVTERPIAERVYFDAGLAVARSDHQNSDHQNNGDDWCLNTHYGPSKGETPPTFSIRPYFANLTVCAQVTIPRPSRASCLTRKHGGSRICSP